ncbi:MAG: YbaB/EbfC family nucleoid-associated protein [Patescibacteria group bacterium]|jgi:DNA-binding protein YbaB|nr:YbaB/EbfC family nucleoid-associated protein [Patescibacteria group bacterium]
MFDKLKQLQNLQSQAQRMKNELAQEKIQVENHGLKLTITGDQKIIDLQLNPELSFEDNQKYLIDLINQAINNVQKLMADKAKSMINLPF